MILLISSFLLIASCLLALISSNWLPYEDRRLSPEERAKDLTTRLNLDVLTGGVSPQGRLPVVPPADMETVETRCEDLVTDIRPYTDSEGNVYTLGFGLQYE